MVSLQILVWRQVFNFGSTDRSYSYSLYHVHIPVHVCLYSVHGFCCCVSMSISALRTTCSKCSKSYQRCTAICTFLASTFGQKYSSKTSATCTCTYTVSVPVCLERFSQSEVNTAQSQNMCATGFIYGESRVYVPPSPPPPHTRTLSLFRSCMLYKAAPLIFCLPPIKFSIEHLSPFEQKFPQCTCTYSIVPFIVARPLPHVQPLQDLLYYMYVCFVSRESPYVYVGGNCVHVHRSLPLLDILKRLQTKDLQLLLTNPYSQQQELYTTFQTRFWVV